jgi:hypothetical protein
MLDFDWIPGPIRPLEDPPPKRSAIHVYQDRSRSGQISAARQPVRPVTILFSVALCVVLLSLSIGLAVDGDKSAGKVTAGPPTAQPSPDAAALLNPGAAAARIEARLREAAVARGIPPEVLYAIAYAESRWQQFDTDGEPLVSPTNDVGIMQVHATGRGDIDRLKTDIDYNIAVGADILLGKRAMVPTIGDGAKDCYENWFYAVWAYNGWTANNPYPRVIWDIICDGPQGWWTGVPVTPVSSFSLVNGLGVEIPTPQPAHYATTTILSRPAPGALLPPCCP